MTMGTSFYYLTLTPLFSATAPQLAQVGPLPIEDQVHSRQGTWHNPVSEQLSSGWQQGHGENTCCLVIGRCY